MKKIKNRYIIQIIILLIFAFLTFYKLPYLVLKPGGIDDISKQYKIENGNKINGSVNTTYVLESQPNIPYFLYAKIKGYKISKIKDEVIEDLAFTRKIEKLMYESAISNAIYVAYKKANKEIDISNLKEYIYINSNLNSPLEVGDLLLEVNGIKLEQIDDIKNIINNDEDDFVTIKYERNNKIYEDEIEIMYVDNQKKLGVLLITVFDYKTNPKITYNLSKNTYGPSGGAMTTLSIYCSLIDNDLLKGRKIAGTGEIYADGTVGPVGGIDYKIISADKKKADIFFVPEYNYEEAKETKEKNKLKIEIVSVENFDDIINYLENN